MGQSWALWIHIEVLDSRWSDTRSVDEMLPTPEVPDMTDEQAAQLAQVLDLVQRQAQSDAVWHQTVPDPITGSDSAMWAQVSNANANAAAAAAGLNDLTARLIAAGVLPP